jgi:hypothetical protein
MMVQYAVGAVPIEPENKKRYAIGGQSLGFNYAHNTRPLTSFRDEYRAQKYGTITAEPEKSWYEHVGRFVTRLIPFYQYMTEEGRKLAEAMPAEARSQQNFLEFTKLLDWTIGGNTAVAFFGRKAIKSLEQQSAQNIMENLITGKTKTAIQQRQVKNQQYIDELFDDLTHPADLSVAQRNQKIINQTVKGNTERILPVKHAQPTDRIKAIQEANQKIIQSIDLEVPQRRLGTVLSKEAIEKTKDLTQLAKETIRLKGQDLSETSKVLRAAAKSQRSYPQWWERTAEDMLDEKDIMYFHSGLPLREGLDSTQRLIKETAGKVWWKPPTRKDLKVREQIIGIPQWLSKKYPQIKKLYDIEMARGDARTELQQQFLEGLEPFFKLKGADYDAVKRILLLGDKEGKVFDTVDLAKAGLSQRGIEAYTAVRQTLDDVQSFFWRKIKEMGVPDDEIMALRQQIGNIVGYFPRVRTGKYFVRAIKEGEPARRIQFNTGLAGQRIKSQLAKEGYEIVDSGKVTKLPEEVYFQINPEALSQVIDVASKNFDEAIQQELKQNVANIFKQRGWGQHGISRQNFIEGFETGNLKKVLYDYVNGFAGYTTKMDAAQQFRKTLVNMAFDKSEKGIPAAEAPRLFRWGEEYVRDVMANSDTTDIISSGIRAASFHKYLGAVLKSGFVNATQNAIAAAPRLSLETRWAYPKLSKAMADIVAHYAPKGKQLLNEEQKALRIALQKRWGHEQYVRELMGDIGNYGKIPNVVQKIMGGPMAIAERFNRQSTFLAGFRAFRKQGLGFDEAIERAGQVVEDSHFTYGKSNLPSLFRGSIPAKLARSAYTFRTFPHHYINLLAVLNRTDKKAVVKALGSIVAVGGISSIPLAKTLESIAQRYGYQPRQWFKSKIKEFGLEEVEDEIVYGLPALLDVDISGSIGMEIPGQHGLSSDDPRAMILEGATDVLGVPFSYIDDTIKATEHLYNGDIYRAIENSPITPMVFSNAMKAKRLAIEGQTTRAGKAILDDEGKPVKYTTFQAVKKGVFGFQPVESSKRYQSYRARRAQTVFWNKQRERLLSQFRRMINRYGFGSKQADAVLKDIQRYRLSVPSHGTQITPETLMQRLTDTFTRKEQLLRMEIK